MFPHLLKKQHFKQPQEQTPEQKTRAGTKGLITVNNKESSYQKNILKSLPSAPHPKCYKTRVDAEQNPRAFEQFQNQQQNESHVCDRIRTTSENADIILLPGQKIHGLFPHPFMRLPKNPAEAQFAERMHKRPVRVFAST
jgi:hypothetical protein